MTIISITAFQTLTAILDRSTLFLFVGDMLSGGAGEGSEDRHIASNAKPVSSGKPFHVAHQFRVISLDRIGAPIYWGIA
jgi:hypothetical protein